MEVFLKKVPERTTEKNLTEFLQPILAILSIEDFYCRKRKGQDCAFLTFLQRQDGDRFLARYGYVKGPFGQPYLPPGREALSFQGIPLQCTLSTKPPDRYALKHLEAEAKSKKRQKGRSSRDDASTALNRIPSLYQISSVSSGMWEYSSSSELVFVSHFSWMEPGTVRFSAKAIIVSLGSGQRIDIPYTTIHAIACEPHSTMAIGLTEPPRLFQPVEEDIQASELHHLLASLKFKSPIGPSRFRVPALAAEHAKISGVCLVYYIQMIDMTYNEQMKALRLASSIPAAVRLNTPRRMPNAKYQATMTGLLQALATTYVALPFAIKFQVQRLAQNTYLGPSTVLALLPDIKSFCENSDVLTCAAAIKNASLQLPFRGPESDGTKFKLDALKRVLWDHKRRLGGDNQQLVDWTVTENTTPIHRVLITPSGTYLYGPEPVSKNRVLRKYSDHSEYFIRVQFADEDGLQILHHFQISNDNIFNGRYKTVLEKGLDVAGRHFAFLGFSHSSLRAQSCWFMAPFLHEGRLLLDRMLIKGLGDFTHIQIPAKCAARIGQAFSETPTAVELPAGVVKQIKDVERNGRVFSDGVGTVSMSVLRKIWNRLPSTKKTKPTLFQIRYSGKCNIMRQVLLSGTKHGLHSCASDSLPMCVPIRNDYLD